MNQADYRQAIVNLRPAGPEDRPKVYDWLVGNYENPSFSPGEAIPTWEEYCSDYRPLFFDQSRVRQGGLYIILAGREECGALSYDARFCPPGSVDVDIWLKGEEYCNQGLGSAALAMLCSRLNAELGFRELVMCPSSSNPRAIRAYEKCGFSLMTQGGPEEAKHKERLDGPDGVVMIRSF